ncbi:MAG TPA: hypothetical protein VLA82_00730 [Actinomycetota bacterium]|nr:hypothetical protein [Actinomycetota bacterium]
MRRLATISLIATLMIGLLPVAARAHHRPTVFCSPSGDVCQSTRKVDGIRVLRITLAARYFHRYDLCVTDPGGDRTCETFRIRERGSLFGSSVRWKRHFPRSGPGAYEVRWRMLPDRARVGRTLGFHVPPA